jgi:hypothetical protein
METKKQWVLPEVTEIQINNAGGGGGDAGSQAEPVS